MDSGRVVVKCKSCGIYFSPAYMGLYGVCDRCRKDSKMEKIDAFVETFKPGDLRVNKDIKFGGTSLEEIRNKTEEILKIKDEIETRRKNDTNPLDSQVGGSHYKDTKIQPVEYAHANKLDFFQGSVVKYITRFRSKNGKQDLEKAKHFIDLLIKLEYGE